GVRAAEGGGGERDHRPDAGPGPVLGPPGLGPERGLVCAPGPGPEAAPCADHEACAGLPAAFPVPVPEHRGAETAVLSARRLVRTVRPATLRDLCGTRFTPAPSHVRITGEPGLPGPSGLKRASLHPGRPRYEPPPDPFRAGNA